ncbi:MAG: AMP phosphorylase [Candidatus Heimdallarchaeota archaeon LC_2]|nr:MAG: AMP phosphorylase [Candidatus Heimdallarchaeota archaeon LC_2]
MITIQVSILDIRAIEPVVMISRQTAHQLRLRHTDIVNLIYDKNELVASPVVVQGFIEDGVVGISEFHANKLGVKQGSKVDILARRPPQSYDLIKKKIGGYEWSANDVRSIVNDISRNRYTSMEIASFALVSQFQGYKENELVEVAKSMAEAGTQFNFNEKTYDKHSIGGVPGNKITPIIVSIVAAAGLLIPKTSSRAITSPSGTADTMEVLCNVKFTPEEISELAPKSRGMIVWNAPLNLSPLDNIVIDVKRQLGIDPPDQMLASIVSTKIAMGVDGLVFDIPTGYGTKMKDRKVATKYAHSLIGLCRNLGIDVEAALTLGEQPLGFNIGPALEAQEALRVLENVKTDNVRAVSVKEKSVELAGILFEIAKICPPGKGAALAEEYLTSGKALKKFKEIVEIQGGDKNITSESVTIGDYNSEIPAPKDGYIASIDNKIIKNVCTAAGTPRDKGAGIILHAKVGEFVHEGEKLFTIYSDTEAKLSLAIQTATTQLPFTIEGMIISRVSSIPEKNI